MHMQSSLMMGSSALYFEWLAQAGGGAGGGSGVIFTVNITGSGGGGGGHDEGMASLEPGGSLDIVIGPGGLPQSGDAGLPGGDTILGDIVTVLGGGFGGTTIKVGGDGGSGGGGPSGGAGHGISGQGHDGGSAGDSGGGGGAGSDAAGGVGGLPVASSISGAAENFGGGGNSGNFGGGSGGHGRGGNGAAPVEDDSPGTAGDDGRVVIRYAGPPQATGGTIVTAGGFTTHTFTEDGTFTVDGGAPPPPPGTDGEFDLETPEGVVLGAAAGIL